MFVAVILFFVFNEQTEPWRECRMAEQEVRYVSLFVFYFWHTKFDGRNLEKERYMLQMLANSKWCRSIAFVKYRFAPTSP